MQAPPKPQRILSVDAFRGITILVMVFVNELAGIRDIPQWMKHVAADADAMKLLRLPDREWFDWLCCRGGQLHRFQHLPFQYNTFC